MNKLTVKSVREKVERAEVLNEEEREIYRKFNLQSYEPKPKVEVSKDLLTINKLLNQFKFNIAEDRGLFYIEDCRKTPPKRINENNGYRDENEAINRMAGVILSEYEKSAFLYKLARVHNADLDEKIRKNRGYRKLT